MKPQELKQRLETLSPGTLAEVVDLTGTQDHYQAVVVSTLFEGKMTIDRHRMVFELIQTEVDSGEVHAFTLKTYTPEVYKAQSKA